MGIKRRLLLVISLTLLMIAGAATTYAAEQVATRELTVQEAKLQKEVEQMLVCQDSCGMILDGCDNSTAEYMRAIVNEKIIQGMNKDEIITHFVSIYGEQVLSAPPKKGFNLTAWVTPFLFVLGGVVLIYLMVDKWVFTNRLNAEDIAEESTELNQVQAEIYKEKLAEELRKRW